jgi:hypothetical protein
MLRGFSLFALVAMACWFSSGCCMNTMCCGGPQTLGCGSCGTSCGGPSCGAPCGGPTCGPACGGCASCGPVNDCGCDSCSTGCGSCLLKPVRELAGHAHRSLTCGAGCGELYIDEWISDPPDACDPCGCHGEWNGGGCHEWPLLSKLKWLWNGHRYYGDCETGCTTCGGSSHVVGDYQAMDGYYEEDGYTEVIQGDAMYGQPKLAPQRSVAPSPMPAPGSSALRRRPATYMQH